MPARLPPAANRLLEQLTGWLFWLSGMALLASVILVPPWLQGQQLTWQHELLVAQVERVADQEKVYRRVIEAMSARDPVLLERLAFHQLHQKPAGATVLELNTARTRVLLATGASATHGHHDPDVPGIIPGVVPGRNWPDSSWRAMGEEFRAYEPVRSILVALTTGWTRFGLLATGIALLIATLFLDNRRRKRLCAAMPVNDLIPVGREALR